MHQCVYAGNTSHPTIFHVILEAAITTLQVRQASWRPGRNSVFYSDFLRVDMALAYCGEQFNLCKKSSSKNTLKKKKSKFKLDQMSSHCEADKVINKFGHSFCFWGGIYRLYLLWWFWICFPISYPKFERSKNISQTIWDFPKSSIWFQRLFFHIIKNKKY